MMNIKAFIKRHPVLTYYVLTFAISWGGVLLVIGGRSGIPGTTWQTDPRLPFVILALLAGPSVAGILLTGLVYGRAGLRELLSRLLRWRVGARWYAVALLTAPLLMTAILFALSLLSPEFLPAIVTTDDKASLLLLGIAVGLGGGFLEELGWTGFAIPGLRQRHGVLATGLIVGVLWGAWHFLVNGWVRQYLQRALPGPLPAPVLLLWCRATGGLQGAHGVGLRPDREPARGAAHARESHRQHDRHPRACGNRGALLDLVPRLDRRAVGRRCSGRLGQQRKALAR